MSASPTTTKTTTAAGEPVGAAPPRLLGTLSRWISLCFGIIAVLVFFLIAGEDWLTIANYTLIAAIAALGLNVLSGYTGQISLGIAFFMAIGAYTAAWLGGPPAPPCHLPASLCQPLGLGQSFLIWLPAAGIVAALVGALIGPTALRLKGFYLGIVTLALIFVGHYLFTSVSAVTRVTGGPKGRDFPAPAFGDFSFSAQNNIFGIAITSGQEYFLLLVLILGLSALFVANVMRSRAGRAFQAVRDNEVGAAIMGVNLFQAKMGAFILSSFLAGIAGALLAAFNRYIIPDSWDLALSIQFVAAIIVGGIGSVWGSILGAAFVFALPRLIDQFSLLPPSSTSTSLTSGDLNALIYGLLIVVFLLFEPGGVIGLVRRSHALTRKFNAHDREGGEPVEMTDLPATDSKTQFNVGDSGLAQGQSE